MDIIDALKNRQPDEDGMHTYHQVVRCTANGTQVLGAFLTQKRADEVLEDQAPRDAQRVRFSNGDVCAGEYMTETYRVSDTYVRSRT